MLWKIIALAVAGLMSGAAFAQSNVTVYGNLDIGYLNGDYGQKVTNRLTGAYTKDSSDYSSTGFQGGALSSNRLGFMGTEDLGNGLKAKFQLEFGLNEGDYMGMDSGADTGNQAAVGSVGGGDSTQWGATTIRYQNIGLEGNFGSVTLGRQATLIDNVWAVGSATMKNNAVGDMYSFGGADARGNELITYMSPNFSGFQVGAQYGKGKTNDKFSLSPNAVTDTTDTAEHTNYGLSLTYANGPLSVGFGYNKEINDAYSTDQTAVGGAAKDGTAFNRDSWLIGANYNFGVAKVFGQYFDGNRTRHTYNAAVAPATDRKRGEDYKGWELGVQVPMGAFTFAGSYFDYSGSMNDHTSGAAFSDKTNTDANGYQLAALYSLSKRSTAYVMYGNQWQRDSLRRTNALVSTKTSTDHDQFAIGLRHSF